MSKKLHLYKLSKTEEVIFSINENIASLTNKINDLSQEQTIKSRISQYKNSCISIKNEISSIETYVSEKKIRREQIESALYGGKVTNGKELNELEEESNSLLIQIEQLDEDLITKLTELENEERRIRDGEIDLNRIISKGEEFRRDALIEIETHKKRLEDLNTEKATLINQIENDLVMRYYDLKNKKSGRAISEVIDNACSICGAELPPSERQKARLQDTFSYCPSCGRLLYSQ